jgi:hypothetical protein
MEEIYGKIQIHFLLSSYLDPATRQLAKAVPATQS